MSAKPLNLVTDELPGFFAYNTMLQEKFPSGCGPVVMWEPITGLMLLIFELFINLVLTFTTQIQRSIKRH